MLEGHAPEDESWCDCQGWSFQILNPARNVKVVSSYTNITHSIKYRRLVQLHGSNLCDFANKLVSVLNPTASNASSTIPKRQTEA